MIDIATRKSFNHLALAAVSGFLLSLALGAISAYTTFGVCFVMALVIGALLLTPVNAEAVKWLCTAATCVGFALTLSAADANPGHLFTMFTLMCMVLTGGMGAQAILQAEEVRMEAAYARIGG